MSYLRFRDEEESHVGGTVATVLLGALAGFAVGMYVSQRVGGFSGLATKVKRRGASGEDTSTSAPPVADDFADDEFDDDEIVDDESNELEDRVLEAFRNDPILSERAVDIGAIGESSIELAGSVETEEESALAVTIARGVPGVTTVVNLITVGDEEERVAEHSRKFAEGDEAHTEAHWEGRTVGTGRPRQGTSTDLDRHADPRVELAEKWTSADAQITDAADDMEGIAERRQREKKAPKGVPAADHVTQA
ncbi:MAG: transport-associated protein [Gemmatimonadetes bacterium]|nr:transport-associated protein [Gemmatimonadota bacterium]